MINNPTHKTFNQHIKSLKPKTRHQKLKKPTNPYTNPVTKKSLDAAAENSCRGQFPIKQHCKGTGTAHVVNTQVNIE